MIEGLLGYVGRDNLLSTALGHIRKNRNVIFVGPSGSGKSALLNMVSAEIAESKPLALPMLIPFCNPLKDFVLVLFEKMYRRRLLPREYLEKDWEVLLKQLKRDHYHNSIKVILQSFAKYPGVFLAIDNLDHLTPIGRSIVLNILESSAIVCAAASKKTQNLQRLFYQFQEIEIPPLSDSVVQPVIKEYLSTRGLLVEDPKHFVEHVTFKAAGSPLALENLLLYFEKEPHVTTDLVRSVVQNAGRKEVSLEWIFLLYVAFIIVLRFAARATMNKPLYVISSAIVAFLFVGSRFFFRGKKEPL